MERRYRKLPAAVSHAAHLLAGLAAAVLHGQSVGMNADPEAQALAACFQAMPVEPKPVLQDAFDGTIGGRVTGLVALGPGQGAEQVPVDQAALFPDDRSAALHVYYGPFVPRRGRFSLDLRVDVLPRDHHFMTLFSVGTGGNTCMLARFGLDRRITAHILSPAETIRLSSEPLSLAAWHRFELSYGPEGALLRVDGAIHDYSVDYSAPYACDRTNAFYLGDQPWWDAGGKKAVFYPLDSFVGSLDRLQWHRLGKDLPKGSTR